MEDDKLLGVEDDLVEEEAEDEEEKQHIEQLALNSNFDPGLLVDCWEEAAAVTTTTTTTNSSVANSLPDDTNSSQHTKLSATNTTPSRVGNSGVGGSAGSLKGDEDAAWDEFDKAQQSIILSSMTRTPPPPNFGNDNDNANDNNEADASTSDVEETTSNGVPTLPPFETTTTGTGALQQQSDLEPSATTVPSQATQGATVTFPPVLSGGSTAGSVAGQGVPFFPGMSASMDSTSLLPLAFNALAAGVDLSAFFNPATAAGATASSGSITPPIPNPLAAAPSGVLSSVSTATAASTLLQVPLQPLQDTGEPSTTATAATPAAPAPKKPPPSKKRAAGGRRGKSSSNKGGLRQQPSASNHNHNNGEEDEEEPPFMLFDAPVELRHNFIQSQRAHGLPILHDNNSFHFARSAAAVSAAPGASTAFPASSANSTAATSAYSMPRLADARHGDDTAGNKRIKNAKEQKRAQRITELIEQLRVRMEKGGWKVGIKSKLHTLSSCSDYVKHLVQTTKEKEAAVEAARSDLETKRRKIEEDKSAQPSEPESTTSSLTVSSGSRSTNKKAHGAREISNDTETKNNTVAEVEETTNDSHKKPPENKSATQDGAFAGCAEKASEGSDDSSPDKKRKLSSHESNSDEYFSSVDNDDSGKKRRNNGVGQNVSIGPISNVSDITDNNKYSKSSSSSSEENTMSATPDNANKAISRKEGDADPSAQNTVCSDAAVAETSDARDHSNDSSTSRGNSEKRGVSIQTITTTTSSHRKRKLKDLSTVGGAKNKPSRDSTSLERTFRLDYEEVFLKSNVPQIIASTTGRIVAHNDMFLRATRLYRKQVERLTIFSLVQAGMLSNLFELVAASLRDQQEQTDSTVSPPPSSTPNTTPLQDYSTMTLPCVPFHKDRPPLYMTVTLMTDEDVRKRCFHCVFTDCAPGAKGSVGSVTRQLLETIFQPIGSCDHNSKAHSSSDTSSHNESSRADATSGTSMLIQNKKKQQPSHRGDEAR